MATLLASYNGSWVGPSPSYFRVVAQIWQNSDTGSGYNLFLRRYVEVKSGSGFGGTILTLSWSYNGYQSYTIDKEGAYAITDTQLGTKAYGSTYSLAASSTKAYYTNYSGSTFTSSVAVSYTVPQSGKYTLTFNPNGGTLPKPGNNLYSSLNELNSVTVTYGARDYNKMLEDIPTRTGYVFKGWYTDINDGVQMYDAQGYCTNEGTYWKDNLWQYKGGITVYARWEANTYTIEYNGNGHTSGSTASSTHTYDVSSALTLNGYVKDGYVLSGWSTNADGSGIIYSDGRNVLNLAISGTVTLYAVWGTNTIAIYKNGTCECVEFVETEQDAGFYATGKIYDNNFVEGDSMAFNSTSMQFTELIER